MCLSRLFIPTAHEICIGHAGHFYNCENGHTFVITEVRESFSNARLCINDALVVWWCHGGIEVSRVSGADRRWRSPSHRIEHPRG